MELNKGKITGMGETKPFDKVGRVFLKTGFERA